MTPHQRPVDRAMGEEYQDKQAIRSLWIQEVRMIAEQNPRSDEPWYLTLSGADGRDIQLIIEDGLVTLTEVNSIAEKDQHRIVAVERSNLAILELQKKFVGLKIKEVDFRELVRGENCFRWPEGDDDKLCRAHVINLDLNAPLTVQRNDGRIVFPVIEWIKKLCLIHSRPPSNWVLCLTLHGEVSWPDELVEDANRFTHKFLSENILREPNFADGFRNFLGEEVYNFTINNDDFVFPCLSRSDQQKLIMILVPKLIAKLVHNEGWQVDTKYNLQYGGGPRAPMVTWIVRFLWDNNSLATPDAVYRESLRNIFANICKVTAQGEFLKQN